MIKDIITYEWGRAMTDSNYVQQREAKRAAAVKITDAAFIAVRSRGGSLVPWEQQALAEAVGAIFRGAYRLAQVFANDVLAQEKHSPTAQIDPAFKRFDLTTLASAFSEARAQPVLPYPVLGPIIVGSG
jgi:hypothetical protein